MADLKPIQVYLNKEQHQWLSDKKKKGISKTAVLANLVDEAMNKDKK